MHKFTVSDLPSEREIYEQAALDEEAFLIDHVKQLVRDMPAPKGWHKQQRPGRPKKKRRGRKEVFGWRSMVLVLVLKAFHEFTYRETTSHLRAHASVRERLDLPRAPSPKTIRTAFERIPESWLRELNTRLVASAEKKLSAVPVPGMSGWTVLE